MKRFCVRAALLGRFWGMSSSGGGVAGWLVDLVAFLRLLRLVRKMNEVRRCCDRRD